MSYKETLIDDIEISNRTRHILDNLKIKTVGDLEAKDLNDSSIKKIKNVGNKTFLEIKSIISNAKNETAQLTAQYPKDVENMLNVFGFSSISALTKAITMQKINLNQCKDELDLYKKQIDYITKGAGTQSFISVVKIIEELRRAVDKLESDNKKLKAYISEPLFDIILSNKQK